MTTRRNATIKYAIAGICLAFSCQTTLAEAIRWNNYLEAAQVEANQSGKLVLVHFYTSSCGPCKKLERDVFSQPQIAAAMQQHYVPVKLDADASPALANKFGITRVPTEVVLTPQGQVVQKLSCPLEPAPYLDQLVNVAKYNPQRAYNLNSSPAVNAAYAGLNIGQQPGAQLAQQAQPPVTQPAIPTVTQNPYVTAQTAQAPRQQAVSAPAAASPQVAQQNQNAANPYGDRYAGAMTASGDITPTPSNPPVVETPTAPTTPPVIEVPKTVVAQTVNQATTPPTAPTENPAAAVAAATTNPTAAGNPPSTTTLAENWPPQLPAGTPPLAFEGYCPVSLKESKKWVRGNKLYGAFHRGRTYLFAGEAQRQQFMANPDAFSPVFSGNDPVKLLDESVEVAGSRKYGFEYRNAFYLFSSKETMERFARQPDHYSAGVRQAMNRLDSPNGTIRR